MWDLVSQLVIEPWPPASGALSLSHGTIREVPTHLFLNTLIFSTLQNVEQITAELPFDGASGIHGALTLSLSTLPTKES